MTLSRFAAPLVAVLLAACAGPAASPGDAPPSQSEAQGRMCGGIAAFACGAGQYCAMESGVCRTTADASGVCRPQPDACTAQYAPVCGCDGRTYSNACAAAAAGASVAASGPC